MLANSAMDFRRVITLLALMTSSRVSIRWEESEWPLWIIVGSIILRRSFELKPPGLLPPPRCEYGHRAHWYNRLSKPDSVGAREVSSSEPLRCRQMSTYWRQVLLGLPNVCSEPVISTSATANQPTWNCKPAHSSPLSTNEPSTSPESSPAGRSSTFRQANATPATLQVAPDSVQTGDSWP